MLVGNTITVCNTLEQNPQMRSVTTGMSARTGHMWQHVATCGNKKQSIRQQCMRTAAMQQTPETPLCHNPRPDTNTQQQLLPHFLAFFKAGKATGAGCHCNRTAA
jgi:hypothetical protein